jgi:hypothetical protein
LLVCCEHKHKHKHKYRDEGLTPKIPDDCPPLLAETMRMCWNKNHNQRPVSFLSLIDFEFILLFQNEKRKRRRKSEKDWNSVKCVLRSVL